MNYPLFQKPEKNRNKKHLKLRRAWMSKASGEQEDGPVPAAAAAFGEIFAHTYVAAASGVTGRWAKFFKEASIQIVIWEILKL